MVMELKDEKKNLVSTVAVVYGPTAEDCEARLTEILEAHNGIK